ncbi:cytochrome b/b6 domain-containing protein, partial [Paracoccus simplex]
MSDIHSGDDPVFEGRPLGAPDRASRQTSVYVYEAPVRIWHWINAACIMVLCVTGWLIGSPPPSMQIAEAYDQFVFGYIRFAHFSAAMILTVGFFGRLYWALIGNHHAKQLFYVPIFSRRFWGLCCTNRVRDSSRESRVVAG